MPSLSIYTHNSVQSAGSRVLDSNKFSPSCTLPIFLLNTVAEMWTNYVNIPDKYKLMINVATGGRTTLLISYTDFKEAYMPNTCIHS
jgi:hypothetical protein